MRVEGKKVDFNDPISTTFHTFQIARGEAKPIVKYRGEVGIEIEVEGVGLPKGIPSYWGAHIDGSLRGESMEYVLKQPCARKSALQLLQYLKVKLDAAKAVVNDSPRCSVHVHVNMQDKSLTNCYTYIILYLIFEDLMSSIAGESRIGNLFCLRARDAEFMIDVLAQSARVRKFNPDPEQLRYASVNFCAITKFNSIEFRALRATTDPSIIWGWTSLLLALKDAAAEYRYPNEIVEDFSRMGPDAFIKKIFPGKVGNLFTDQKDYQHSLWDSTRLVQEIAYATDWSVDEKPARMFDIKPNKDFDN